MTMTMAMAWDRVEEWASSVEVEQGGVDSTFRLVQWSGIFKIEEVP